MSQAEMDAALDALEAEHGAFDEPQEEVVEEVVEEVEEEVVEEIEEGPEAKPPGFMGYEEWVAAGKDPKKYRGEEAYSAEFDRIQELKSVKSEIGGLKETMTQVAQVNEEWRKTQEASIRAEYEAKFNQAKEEGDIDAALDAQSKLNDLDRPKPQSPAQPQVNPLIAEFRQNNPLTDHSSPRFNPEYNADVENIYDGMVDKLTRGGQLPMTESQIKRCLDLAKRDANSLHPNLFESPRNNRGAPTIKTKKAKEKKSTDYRARLQDVKTNDGRNKRDTQGALDIYDMLLAKPGGKEAAEKYAKTILGE